MLLCQVREVRGQARTNFRGNREEIKGGVGYWKKKGRERTSID